MEDDYDYCYECSGYGDDYFINEDGELESCCQDCPMNPYRSDDWDEQNMDCKNMKIGYIVRYDLDKNPQLTERFEFREATFTRRISSRGDKVYSKMLQFPIDYEEIVSNANMMKKNQRMILVGEPFLLDDELRDKVVKWVDWANKADPKEYDPFAK